MAHVLVGFSIIITSSTCVITRSLCKHVESCSKSLPTEYHRQLLLKPVKMYALIAWETKNRIAEGREELEVISTSKVTLMNGGKMESGATRVDEIQDKKSQRKRKKKSYGIDFEEDDSTSETEVNDELNSSPGLKEKNGQGKDKKAKKSCRKPEGKENISKKDKEIAISAQHDELVITQILQSSTSSDPVPEHPHFGGKQPKLHKPPKCISVLCREEKDALTNKLEDVTKTLQDTQAKLERIQEELKMLQTMKSNNLDNWEEISNSVWCCPVKVKATVKDSSSRTGLVLALFGLFYPKEELGGKRLRQLDQDIIEAITDFSMIAKLTKEPKPKKLKEGQIEKPRTPASRSDIKQALRIKCNSVINSSRKSLRYDLGINIASDYQ
ncbi:hypothetical protein P5673_018516 [Acropora cervicornis]|uniref:BEN domain-containing protein n=1 Tax=Acropora cervicornis TaxID=6130 RepID=A0AAD9QCP7_ACRCE|nr:hypothetical protein P5673_018516 [Acropora cervicornis]